MNDELYVTGVVIPNGVADHENDVLNKKDILKIFTKYIDRSTDTMHTKIKNKGVDVLANWISEADQEIAGKLVPAGSWLATTRITNPEIIKSINDGDIQGYSLGSIPDFALTQKFWFINKSINYSDLDDMEEVIPLFISFVDKPSNGYKLEIMNYDAYINKRTSEVENMTNKENEIKTGDEKLSVSGFGKIIEALGINKSEDKSVEVKTEQVEVKKEETETKDITNAELLEKIPQAVSEGIKDALEEIIPKTDEKDVEVEKAEDDPKEEEKEKEESTAEKTEKVEVKKRATSKSEAVTQPNKTTNFYQKSGRDEFGCRIR